MQQISNIYQGAQDYWKEIPTNTGKQMMIAFGVAMIFETILSNGNLTQGALAGSVSALATAIHGCVSPLFKQILGNRPLSWGEEMCRTFTAIIGAGAVAAAFGNSSILQRLTGLAIGWGIINFAFPQRRDINAADWMILIPNFPRPVLV